EERLLLLEEGHCLREQALDVCRLAGAGERDFRATSLETLRQMVAAGVGSTLLPVLSVQPPVPASPDLRLVRFSGTPPFRRVAMVWRRSSAIEGLLKAIAGEIRALPAHLLHPPDQRPAGPFVDPPGTAIPSERVPAAHPAPRCPEEPDHPGPAPRLPRVPQARPRPAPAPGSRRTGAVRPWRRPVPRPPGIPGSPCPPVRAVRGGHR